ARDLDDVSNRELLRYYSTREAWVAEVDETGPVLIPYSERDGPRVFEVVNAAGKSPYFKTGVVPGSIVTITGKNLVAEGSATSGNNLFESTGGTVVPVMLRFISTGLQPVDPRHTPVTFGHTRAPVLAVSRTGDVDLVTVQVPFEVGGPTVDLTVALGLKTTR